MIEITLASTFTIDPSKVTIDYWLLKFLENFEVSVYQYNRVFDHLLTADKDQDHFSVIVVRFEDFFKEKLSSYSDLDVMEAKDNLSLLIDKVCSEALGSKRQFIFVFAPSSKKISDLMQGFEGEISQKVSSSSTVKIISSKSILNFFKIDSFFDEYGQDAANMPFSQEGYIAIGTAISRQLYAFLSKPKKVIVSDCDNTLWQGVCAEDGPLGVVITPEHKSLQAFLKEKADKGKLLCLASKNIEKDVWRVFDENPNMVLKKSDIIAAQINWDPKWENIKKISQGLDLATNSFIFIDDNPVEVAEMSVGVPDVAIWHISTDLEELSRQMKNIWELDILNVTDADLERKNFYHTNKERDTYKNQFEDMSEFLRFLEVKSQVSDVGPDSVARCSQITYRTNQFNTNQGLYNESQMSHLLEDKKYIIKMMKVDDKFGSYGLVGLCISYVEDETLYIQDFYMSCRVLNRLSEYYLLEKVVREAHKKGALKIVFKCNPTERNQYAQAFIAKLNIAFNKIEHDPLLFNSNIESLLSYNWNDLLSLQVSLSCAVPSKKKAHSIEHLVSSTTRLMNIQDLEREIFPDQIVFVDTQNLSGIEEIIAVFKQFLKTDDVNVETDFFQSGGSSFSAVMAMSFLCRYFKVNLPLVAIYYNPTPEKLYHEFTNKREGEFIIHSENIDQEKVPLILVHPAGGSSHPYIPLTKYIKDRPLYFLNDPFAYSVTEHFASLDSMCMAYMEEIVKNCKSKEVYLGGWSFGGLATFQLSALLNKKGIRVKKIFLMDSYNPKAFSKEAAKLRQENLLSNQQNENHEMIDLILKRYQSYMNDFIPSETNLPCVLFKCKNQGYVDSELYKSPTNGWGHEFVFNLEKIEVDGAHDSLFDQENIEKFSIKLNQYLEKNDI